MKQQKPSHVERAIQVFDQQYKTAGLQAQRKYPNESLIQFLARRYFAQSVESRRSIRVLEVGCGSGANVWMMAKEGFETFGIDSSREAIDLAEIHLTKKWGVSATLEVGSFTDLPYADHFFDVVVDIVSLQHLNLADSVSALGEVARVLKPSGAFFSYRLSDHSVMYQLTDDRIDSATVSNISDDTLPLANNGPTSFWSPSTAHEVYGKAGLVISGIERIGRTHSSGMLVEYLAIDASLKT